MNLKEALAKLESMGDERRRAFNAKQGLGKMKQFGVATGDIRALAKKIKTDPELAMQLWKSGNIDAQLLAILLMKPKELSAKELDKMVRAATFVWVADWLNAYIVKEQPDADKEKLRVKWMEDGDGWAARAGWNLTAAKIAKGAEGIDLKAMLDLSRLSLLEGLHITVRPHLDQRDGETAGLKCPHARSSMTPASSVG